MSRADAIVRNIRQELKRSGSPEFAQQIQRFFKEPVRAYGWRTPDVRKLAARWRREIAATGDDALLAEVAEKLFAGPTAEETTIGVALLERSVPAMGASEFRRLESWLPRITNWGACDGLCCGLLGPLVAADRARLAAAFRWAKSRNRWHRRAAAVSLVYAARRGIHTDEILKLSDQLLEDEDDMVRKGLGWLLKETAEERRRPVVAYLERVKTRAPRIVLRIACEKFSPGLKRRILG